jgi:aryl-alcohol dehydrogenase-like predicted oxidoreductase
MSAVEARILGASGIQVSPLGAGTQQWGDVRWGYGDSYSRDDLFGAYQAYLDGGVNSFDTSESYAKGVSETLLGEFRRQDGRPIKIFTKYTQSKIYDPSDRRSPKQVMATLDGSLQRLGVEAVDLYQLHYPPSARELDAYLDALAETVKAGKARSIGVSNFNTALFRRAHAYLARQNVPLSANQIGYNLLYRHPETNGMLAACRELNAAVIPILPLAEGVLAGTYRVGGAPYPSGVGTFLKIASMNIFGEDARRKSFVRRLFEKPYFVQREILEPLFVVLDQIAAAHNATIAQVALNWLLASHPNVIPIPGAKNARQARDNAGALSWTLSVEEFSRICQAEATARAAAR